MNTAPEPSGALQEPAGDEAPAFFDPYSLPLPRLTEQVAALGGKPVHALRWYRLLHRPGNEFGQADTGPIPNFPRALTARLRLTARPPAITLSGREEATDGTIKLRLALEDGQAVECVLIPGWDRMTLCLSCQTGCRVGCGFCATGQNSGGRNLTTGEIIAQFHHARQAASGPITNLVFMGMGEPLHNWPAVRDTIAIFRDGNAYSISKRRITVSTSGVLGRMGLVPRESRVPIALSLHATTQELRRRLIPTAGKNPLPDLLAELARMARDDNAIIMLQYLLLQGVNDSPQQARELAALAGGLPCIVNLLPFNHIPGTPYRPSPPASTAAFRRILVESGIRVTTRESRGGDIHGACGQLALETARPARNTAPAGEKHP
ncbi:MAG: 23S rRNA (adenine(2503)-C(2))-methyltransferase RlmN [Deltaproteobacteria bacterium]|nr:23S rRNA (adenine(2503)-C(2))-methyltransferase RlmN [Deltaproteobacteria bacterium]